MASFPNFAWSWSKVSNCFHAITDDSSAWSIASMSHSTRAIDVHLHANVSFDVFKGDCAESIWIVVIGTQEGNKYSVSCLVMSGSLTNCVTFNRAIHTPLSSGMSTVGSFSFDWIWSSLWSLSASWLVWRWVIPACFGWSERLLYCNFISPIIYEHVIDIFGRETRIGQFAETRFWRLWLVRWVSLCLISVTQRSTERLVKFFHCLCWETKESEKTVRLIWVIVTQRLRSGILTCLACSKRLSAN